VGGSVVEQAKSGDPEPRRRRSTRIVHAVPLAVSGEDALGQPFKERTATLIVSCHGCRYQSKHYVPRNGSVELEVQHPEQGRPPRRVRARVAWIQRPRTVRELFQVGVEIAVPGNIWGVAFPPDDWFPWPESASGAAPSSAVAEEPETLPAVVPEAVAEEALPVEEPSPPAPEKVRTMPRPERPEAPAEPSDAASRQVHRIVAEARRQIQEDVKKIVAAVVTAESSHITAAMTSQMRNAATEAVKQALMSHGQAHAERLDVSLREALARLEIVRYEAARGMKEQSEKDTKSVSEAASQAQQVAEAALAQTLSRLESARDEAMRALSMQSRAEGQRIMAQGATRVEDLLNQSLSRIEEAGRSSSELLTQVARTEMEQSVAGALEGLRSDIAATSNEVRRLSSEELEAARKQLAAARDEIARAAHNAMGETLASLDARVDSTRARVAELAREAGELDAAIAQKIGAGRGEWQEHVERELGAARGRWEQLVAETLAGSTDTLRARLEEASSAAVAPALEDLQRRIKGHTAAAQEALESVQAEAGHAVSAMRETSAETAKQAQQSAVEAQRIFGDLEAGIEARVAAARASLEAVRGTLEAGAAEARASLEAARGEGQHLEALLGSVREAQERVQATIGELDALRTAAQEEIRTGLDAGLRARVEQMDEHARQAWQELEARTAPALEAASHESMEKFRARLEEAVRERLAPELARVTETLERLQRGEDHAEQVIVAFRERLHDAAESAVRETGERLQSRVAQIEKDFTASGRDVTSRMLAEIEEKADDTTHKTFEALYKAAEWYQKKAQTSLQTAVERALEQTLASLREKAGEMSSLFASELEHFSRSYAEHTRGLLEESAAKVQESARARTEVETEAARTLITDETRRLAEQQIERARRATEFVAGEVIARVTAQAHDAEAAAAEAAVRAVEQVEERAARTRDEMEVLHVKSAAAFAERLAQEVTDSLSRAQLELNEGLQPVLADWQRERADLQRNWRTALGEMGRAALEEHREHLGNVANSLMVTTVASLSEHSQTILEQLARDAEQRVRQSTAQVFAGLGEVLQYRLTAISKDIAPPAGTPPEKP